MKSQGFWAADWGMWRVSATRTINGLWGARCDGDQKMPNLTEDDAQPAGEENKWSYYTGKHFR